MWVPQQPQLWGLALYIKPLTWANTWPISFFRWVR